MLPEIEHPAVERRDSGEASRDSDSTGPKQRAPNANLDDREHNDIVKHNGHRDEREHHGHAEAPEEPTSTASPAKTSRTRTAAERQQRSLADGDRAPGDQGTLGAALRGAVHPQDPVETQAQGSSHWLRHLRRQCEYLIFNFEIK